MENGKFFMGLDLGTNSCGWAVTDQSYNLIKHGKQSLWGVRLFEEGQSAEERRLKRSNRRRMDRKKWRVDILQDLFSSELSKIDNEFFLRLNNSFYQFEDKKPLGKYSLFNDKSYSDKEYYKDYPTIYHLRQYLKTNTEKPDIRLIYLACHHIVKYRGHFLMDNVSSSITSNDQAYFSEITNNLKHSIEEFIPSVDVYLDFSQDNYDKLISIISSDLSPKRLSENLNLLINPVKNKFTKSIINLISGLKVKTKDIIGNDDYAESSITSFAFSNDKYDTEIEPLILEEFGDTAIVISNIKTLYDWINIKRILKNNSSISEAMIDLYIKHKNDLLSIKKTYRKYFSKQDYYTMFRSSNEEDNYCSYVKTTQVNNQKKYVKGCSREIFYKAVKTKLESISNFSSDEIINKVLNDIQDESFLPKLSTKSNASLPYQIHYNELEIILKNNSRFFPFFENKDEEEFSFVDKIMNLMTFKVPYYVGPLNAYHNNENGGYSWIVRKEEGKILPWNFTHLVNEEESQKAFILRMTNKCTYLKGKDVLPKYSLLYSEYSLLNEINKMQINKELISVEVRNLLIDKLFKKVKKVSLESLKSFFKRNGFVSNTKDIIITGIDGEIKNSLSSYIDFEKIFGEISYSNINMIERIIFLLTIFEDKNILRNIIKEEFSLSNDIISKVCRLNYSGWGRFSKEFLESELYRIDENGETHSIMSIMRCSNSNLMEALYNPKYKLNELVDQINQGIIVCSDFTYSNLVDSLNCSPAIKRSIWQALKIVKEVSKTLKKPIDKFYVEVTREKLESKKTPSRRYLIENYLKSAKEFKIDYEKLNNQLNKVSDSQLRSDKLFLYFMQLGRCMYSNEPIDIDSLSTGKYDIDHIIPRSFLKDDSIDNRVLVLSDYNKQKGDIYPISPLIQNKMEIFWKKLDDNKLISSKKFSKLMRVTKLTDDEIGDFINRQLVFTSQSVKSLIEALKIVSPTSEIIYSKAGNVSDFRRDFELLKSREVNDLHHAHDAYLNIVVGNVYHSKYGYDARKVIARIKNNNDSIGTKKIFEKNILGAWESSGKSIHTVKSNLSRTDVLFTRMTYDAKGQFYDETKYPKNKGLFPLIERSSDPKSNPAKYGGYNSLKIAFFVVVESDNKKGERVITVEGIPVIYSKRINDNPNFLYTVLNEYLILKNPKIIVNHLQIKSLLRIDKTLFSLSGKTGDSLIVMNASQMFTDQWTSDYIRLITKHKETISKINEIEEFNGTDLVISESKNINKPDLKISLSDNLKLYDLITNQLKKPIYQHLSIASMVSKLENSRIEFTNKNVRIQAYVLYEMLHLIQTKSTKSNLSYIADNSKFLGSNTINKNITKCNIEIIDQSITGIYQNVRWKNNYGI